MAGKARRQSHRMSLLLVLLMPALSCNGAGARPRAVRPQALRRTGVRGHSPAASVNSHPKMMMVLLLLTGRPRGSRGIMIWLLLL